MEYLLTTNGLTKQYGRHKAVNAVNLHIRQGDIYGLIGRNGAGKTTIFENAQRTCCAYGGRVFHYLAKQAGIHMNICPV